MYTGVLGAILSRYSLGFLMGMATQAQAVPSLQRIRYNKPALLSDLQQLLPASHAFQ